MDVSEYSGDPKSCCLIMDWALDENYLEVPLMIDWNNGGSIKTSHVPVIHGPKLTQTGRKTKPNVFIKYCPFCGKKFQDV